MPLGLVSTNWGGTPIEAWMPVDAINACSTSGKPASPPPSLSLQPEYPWTAPRAAGSMDPNSPAALYNTMVVPLQHMALTGTLWYQGESNVGSTVYACLQERMLRAWRELFGDEMAFLYTQLSTWSAGGMGFVPAFRQDQVAALDLPAHRHRAGECQCKCDATSYTYSISCVSKAVCVLYLLVAVM